MACDDHTCAPRDRRSAGNSSRGTQIDLRYLTRSIAPRLLLYLLGTFAAASLPMAITGIYGVMAYSVAQRTREIGIRMALGAPRGEVVGMVVKQGMASALSGIAAGVGAARGLTRFMASLLYWAMSAL
jgi:putative ABC transport system permease protein